jgi:hypothetical protein
VSLQASGIADDAAADGSNVSSRLCTLVATRYSVPCVSIHYAATAANSASASFANLVGLLVALCTRAQVRMQLNSSMNAACTANLHVQCNCDARHGT